MKTYTVDELKDFLATHGIEYAHKGIRGLIFKQNGYVFAVFRGSDWSHIRWMCGLSHVDKLLREWQAQK